MPKGNYFIPDPINEPILSYAPGTPEREELLAKYKEMYAQEIDAPMYIGADLVRTGNTIKMEFFIFLSITNQFQCKFFQFCQLHFYQC